MCGFIYCDRSCSFPGRDRSSYAIMGDHQWEIGVNVYMDGKPTYLSATDLATLLSGMPASSIQRIEIMTNPPAKYDASGTSGIINIVRKKNHKAGFNGSVNGSLGEGHYGKYNSGVTLSYKNDHYNLFLIIPAAYVDYNRSYKALTAQAGLRAEETTTRGKDILTDESLIQHYLQLFPTSFLAYKLNAGNELILRAGRRIERAAYSEMIPFRRPLTPTLYFQGNPNLRPHLIQWGKRFQRRGTNR